MPVNQSIQLSSSVGMFGANKATDVKVVQKRLNALMSPNRRSLAEDGIFGQNTGLAITQFQRYVCGFKWPDGLVDTGKTTIRYLNDPASAGKWAIACPVSDQAIGHFVEFLSARTVRVPPTIIAKARKRRELQRLNAELQNITMLIKQKYPKGRPDGLGVLAGIAPSVGTGTQRNLKAGGDWVNKVTKENGAGWGIMAALGFAVATPFLLVAGLAEDTPVTYYELAFEPEVHGKPQEYDKLQRRLKQLRSEIEKLDAMTR